MRLVVCDDHRLFVEPLAVVLAAEGHEVVVTTSPERALSAADENDPDLVLIDWRFPSGDAVDVIRRLHASRPSCPVVVLSGSVDRGDRLAAMAAGAAAFLRKDQSIRAISDALERILGGRQVADVPPPRSRPRSAEAARVRELVGRLTAREREVLRRLVDAQDTVQIARSLGVAPSTARTHLQNVLLKFGVHTRMQAVATVVGAGLDGEL